MKTQERIYVLGTESGENINTTDNLLLAINGTKTKILLKSLFAPNCYKQGEASIKGISILGEFPIVENHIQISENMNICAFNRNSEENVYFIRTEIPFLQNEDKECNKEEIINIITAEYNSITPKEEELEETEEEESEPSQMEEELELDEEELELEEVTTEEEIPEILNKEESDFHVS